jgi:hypothetical protein
MRRCGVRGPSAMIPVFYSVYAKRKLQQTLLMGDDYDH